MKNIDFTDFFNVFLSGATIGELLCYNRKIKAAEVKKMKLAMAQMRMTGLAEVELWRGKRPYISTRRKDMYL